MAKVVSTKRKTTHGAEPTGDGPSNKKRNVNPSASENSTASPWFGSSLLKPRSNVARLRQAFENTPEKEEKNARSKRAVTRAKNKAVKQEKRDSDRDGFGRAIDALKSCADHAGLLNEETCESESPIVSLMRSHVEQLLEYIEQAQRELEDSVL